MEWEPESTHRQETTTGPIIRERFAELVVEHECLCDHVLLVAPADIAHHILKTLSFNQ